MVMTIIRYLKVPFTAFVLFLILLAQACNKDENPPSLSLSGANLVEGVYTTDDSGQLSITISVTAPNGFRQLNIRFDGINIDPHEFMATEDGQVDFNLNYQLDNIIYGSSGSFRIIFQAIDNSNQSTEQIVEVQPALPSIALDEDNPDILNGTLNATVGRIFRLRYRYTFPAGFGQFKIILSVNGNISVTIVNELPPTQGLGVTDAIESFFDNTYLGQELIYTLEVTDILGNTEQIVVPVELIQPPVIIYTSVILEVPSDDENSKSFFSTNIGSTYSLNDVSNTDGNLSKEIDFGYFYDDISMASLTGPGNYPSSIYRLGPNGEEWLTLNITNFRKTSLSNSEFDVLDENSQSEIEAIFEDASGDNILIISNLQEGDIIAFKTDLKNSKNPRGVFRVIGITGNSLQGGQIELEIKVNQ
jgi:hypothetical protein